MHGCLDQISACLTVHRTWLIVPHVQNVVYYNFNELYNVNVSYSLENSGQFEEKPVLRLLNRIHKVTGQADRQTDRRTEYKAK